MNYPEPLIQPEGIHGYVSTQQMYSNILSRFKIHRSVHPLAPTIPDHSEFIELSSRRRIRLIHVKPDPENENVKRSFRLSTEEYWFTRWNRPMRSAACNCSFRRSQRFNKYYDKFSLTLKTETTAEQNDSTENNHNQPKGCTPKSNLIDNYTDKLISDILTAAYVEYIAIKTASKKFIEPQLMGCTNKKANNDRDECDKAVLNQDSNNLNFNDQSNKVQKESDDVNVDGSQVKYRRNGKNCMHGLQFTKSTVSIIVYLKGMQLYNPNALFCYIRNRWYYCYMVLVVQQMYGGMCCIVWSALVTKCLLQICLAMDIVQCRIVRKLIHFQVY